VRQTVDQHRGCHDGVLNASLDADVDNLHTGETENWREHLSERAANVGQTTSSRNDGQGKHLKNVTIHEETRRPGDYDDDGEERTQGFADGGCDAGLEVGDEDSDGQRNEERDDTEKDMVEG